MIVKLVRFLVRFLCWIFPWLRADYRRRINPHRKCPACGAVKTHDIRFDANALKLVLTCVVCECVWAFEPLAKPQKFAKVEQKEEPRP